MGFSTASLKGSGGLFSSSPAGGPPFASPAGGLPLGTGLGMGHGTGLGQGPIFDTKNILEIPTQTWPAGNYQITLQAGDKIYGRQVIKAH